MGSSDRFQLLVQAASPGICRTCGVPFGERPFVETGLDTDFCNKEHVENVNIDINMAGAVYFCELCVIAMSEVFGCMSPEKAKRLAAGLQEQININNELVQKNLGLERIVNGYDLIAMLSGTSSSNSVNYDLDSVMGQGEIPGLEHAPDITGSSGERLPEDGESGITSGSSEIDEFISEPESSGVSSDSGSKPGTSGDNPNTDDVIGF